MKKLNIIWVLFFFLNLGVWGAGVAPTLSVIAESKTASPGSRLALHAKIKNNGPEDFKMVTCSCSNWESWAVEGEMVRIPTGVCEKNVCAPENFPAHGEVEKKIEVVLNEKTLTGPLTFHLRFGEPAGGHGSLRRTILSNPITIEIKR